MTLIKGTETLTVMTLYLPNNERAQRHLLKQQVGYKSRYCAKTLREHGLLADSDAIDESVSRWGLFPRSGLEA